MVFKKSLLLLSLVVLGSSQFLIEESRRQKRQALPVKKWPNKIMFYRYSPSLPEEYRRLFIDSFEYVSSKTCIKFYNDVAEDAKNWVEVVFDDQTRLCNSFIGMMESGQVLNMHSTCIIGLGGAVHEIMHALGIHHMQTRSDRDDYVLVKEISFDYEKVNNSYNPIPFDFGSTMMYPKNENLIPKNLDYSYLMGIMRVSFYDMLLLNDYYNCSCESEIKCENGGYQNPSDCSSCTCPDGFTGPACQDLDGMKFDASSEWQMGHYSAANSFTQGPGEWKKDHILVSAPPNTTIQVQLIKLDRSQCSSKCWRNAVEIKYLKDRRIVNPFVCCDHDNLWNKTRSSTNNPLVIVVHWRTFPTLETIRPQFEWRYRYVIGDQEIIKEETLN